MHHGGLKSTGQLLIRSILRRGVPPLNSATELQRGLFFSLRKNKKVGCGLNRNGIRRGLSWWTFCWPESPIRWVRVGLDLRSGFIVHAARVRMRFRWWNLTLTLTITLTLTATLILVPR